MGLSPRSGSRGCKRVEVLVKLSDEEWAREWAREWVGCNEMVSKLLLSRARLGLSSESKLDKEVFECMR